MKSEAQSTVEVARQLPKHIRAAAQVRWCIVEGEVIDKTVAAAKPKRPKSFEVIHAVLKAREAFLVGLVAGEDLEACRQRAFVAAGVK